MGLESNFDLITLIFIEQLLVILVILETLFSNLWLQYADKYILSINILLFTGIFIPSSAFFYTKDTILLKDLMQSQIRFYTQVLYIYKKKD